MTNEERRQYHEQLPHLAPGQMLIGGIPTSLARPPLESLAETGRVGAGITRVISGIPALAGQAGTAIGEDFYDAYRNAYDLIRGNQIPPDRQHWTPHTAQLTAELVTEMAKSMNTTLPVVPSVAQLQALAHGDISEYMRLTEARRKQAIQMMKDYPVESALNISAVAAPFLRAGSIGALSRSIMEANPEIGLVEATRLARRESYRPGFLAAQGIEGGLPDRALTARVPGGGEVRVVGKPLATTPLGRAAQAVYDRHSARIDPEARLVGRFSEQRRAVRVIEKRQAEAVQRAELLVTQVAQEVGKYVRGTRAERVAALLGRGGADLGKQRARAAGLVYGLQGPAGETSLNVLHAARNDLQRILDEGGKEIPSRARVNVEKQMDRIDQTLERMGLGVDENAVHWTELRNLLHSLGWDPAAIEDTMQLEKHNARVWARQKPGRNPSDYLDAPDGRNMGAFLNSLPEDGVSGVLYQRPGWNRELVGRAKVSEVNPGDTLWDPLDGTPYYIEQKTPGGSLVVRGRDARTGQDFPDTHTIDQQTVGQLVHQPRQVGDKVINDNGLPATIVSTDPERGIVNVVDSAGNHDSWTNSEIAPPGPSYFYSQLEQTVMDPKFQNKVSVDQLIPTLKNKGVKEAEITWSGLEEWMNLLKESNVKSISKQEILDWLHNDSEFNLNEVYLAQDDVRHGSAYGQESYSSRPHDPGYREIVINMGPRAGIRPYRHGHWGGYGSAPHVDNPVAHIRFVLDEPTKTVYVNEFQSDWHKALKDQGVARPPHVTDEEWSRIVGELDGKARAITKEGQAASARLLGIDPADIPAHAWPSQVIMNRLRQDAEDAVDARYATIPVEARPSYAEVNAAKRRVTEEMYATPEWHQLLKVSKIEAKWQRRAELLNRQYYDFSNAVQAAPFTGGAWRTLVLKRAIAEAVANGYDKVAWDAGIVHNVRYQVVDPYSELGVSRYDEYGYDEYAPTPPEQDDYSYLHTNSEITFAAPVFPPGHQKTLFGDARMLNSGLMDEVYPHDFYDRHFESDELVPGAMVVPEDGHLQGQLAEVVSNDVNGIRLRPTGTTRIEFRGRADDPHGSYGEIEITHESQLDPPPAGRTTNYDSHYGYVDEPADFLSDGAAGHYLLPQSMYDSLNRDARTSSDYILDEDSWDQVNADYQDQLENYQQEQAAGQISAEDINGIDVSHTPHGKLYDEIFPNDANKLLKKYKHANGERVKVTEGRREGRYGIEGQSLDTEYGPMKVYEFQITPEMAADVRKGQALFQRQEGVPVGATWAHPDTGRRMVALLENADVSTWLHEMIGHGTAELSQRFPDEWAGVERAMKKPLDQWSEVEHEKFARWTERYFREGKAPTPEVAPLLAQLKAWMRQVYESIKALGRPIPQEARDLLDRYLGKEGEGSIFNEREQAVLKERGDLHARRQELVRKESERLLAQPNADLLDQAHTLMVDGEPHEQQAAYSEIARRRKGAEAHGMPSEEQRLLQRQIKLLDNAIKEAADPQSGYTDALAALITLSEHADTLFRQTILDMAPDEAKAGIEAALEKRRNILVDRWREQGLLPYGTGDALGYFPHASIFESLGKQLKGPVRQAQGSRKVIGKVQVSKIAARKGENLLRRYQSGSMNLDPRVLLNTVNARLRLLQTREARDQLWEIGKPVQSERDVPQGWWVINREGKHVPERLRRAQELTPQEMDDLVAAGEDFDSNVETRQGMDNFLTDYVGSFARPADNVPNEWWDAGELRAVPPEIVDGLLPKPFQGKPGGKAAALGIANSGARAATILGYPVGYMMSNIPANLTLQGLTHPSALVRDNFRAAALRRRNPQLYHQLAQVAGDIMAEAGIPEFYPRAQGGLENVERRMTRTTRRVAQAYGEVADTPFRVGTLMGYARRYGIKSDEDLAALVKGEGKLGDLRDALGQRTRNDLLDFNTLTQSEKETVARYFFLWPLVRAMVKWPVDFARDHPIASAAIAQAGSEEFQKKTDYGRLGTASQRSLRALSIVPVGKHRAIDLSSENPLGGLETVQNLLNTPQALSRGDLGLLRDAVAGMTIPQIRELMNSQPTMQSMIEATIPGAKYLTSSLGKSRGSKIWKREHWWNYMLERNVRFMPEEIDAAMIRSQADKERRSLTGATAQEQRADAEYKALPTILKRAGVTDPADIEAIHNGFEAYDYVNSRTRNLGDAGRVKLVNDAIRKFYPQYASDLIPADQMSKAEQQRYYARVRNILYATHTRVISTGEKMGILKGG